MLSPNQRNPEMGPRVQYLPKLIMARSLALVITLTDSLLVPIRSSSIENWVSRRKLMHVTTSASSGTVVSHEF